MRAQLPPLSLWAMEWPTWAPWIGGVLLACILVYLFRYEIFVRAPLFVLRWTVYRLHAHGVENIPASGPVLLVSNHVSWIDFLLIMAATRRKVRFLIWAPFMKIPFLRLLLKLMRVIPIDGSGGPRAIIQSLRLASEALSHGEAVCIFAEGGITRTGFLLPFQRGFEQIVKKTPAPIVPICLDHVWGSIFSYQDRKFLWKLPRQLPYHVYLSVGAPMPPSADAFTVRQAIQNLSADSAIRRSATHVPVHRRFVRMACRHPFRPCFIDENGAKKLLSYGEVLVAAKILNRRLKPILGEETMIGLWLPSSAGGAIANICVALLGKTSVNLNYTAGPDVIQSSIRQCNIKHVLTSKLFCHKMPLDPGAGVELVYLEDFRKGIGTFERIRSFLSVLLVPGFVQERWILGLGKHTSEDLLTIIFSSGSTGEPKGIMLTQGNVAANAESVIQAIDPSPRDRLLGILPFFHSFGYTVTLWVPLQVGASVIYHPNPLQAREVGELSKKYSATIFLSTPTFLRSYIKRCEPGDFKTLRILVCGAEKLPQSVAKDFKDKFGIFPMEGYGCTELAPVAAVNTPDWQQGSQRQIGHKPGTIGQPIPGVAARIVHRDTGADQPPGEEGLLLIRGANVMKGYLGRDDLTQKKMRDGWYITGDLAKFDEDGFLTITGREERFAKVGGEMVPLEKVEDEIHQVLASTERVAAVTAIPDAKKGERLIVLHLALPDSKTAQEISKQLGDRGLPNLFIPGPKDFFLVSDLPILGSGKLDLKKCKQRAMELAGAE